MPINQLDLPAIHQAAVQTQGMRQRNMMAGELGPVQLEGARTQNLLAQQQLEAASQPKPIDPEDVRRAVEWGDTPEKWDQAVDVFVQEGNPQFARYKGQFHRREELKALLAAQPSGKPLSGPGKVAADIEAGILPAGTPLRTPKGPLVQVNTGATGIDYGNPPKNHAWARDEGGKVLTETDPETGYKSPIAVPVAGGPVEVKRKSEAEQAEAKKQAKKTQADVVTQDIDRAISMTEGASIPVTGFGSLLAAVPGTPAHDLSAKLDTVKANIGFDKLQSMRDNSPTGGALGQVSEFENKMLQATFGSLAQSQSQEEFLFNLRRLKETYLDIVHGPGVRPGQQGAAQAKQQKYPDGTIATNAAGDKMIMEGGSWVPAQ